MNSQMESALRSAGDDGGARMRDIDINRIPEAGAEDHVHQQWRTINTMDLKNHDQAGGGGGSSSTTASHSSWPWPPCKKLRLSKPQSQLLEDSFRLSSSLTPKHKEDLAMKLQLTPRQVEVWFQNRRARSKLRQTEMECEYLRMWFNSLTEQNRCLQKEVDELRASKVEPPTVLLADTTEPVLASSLYMCPRCQCIATSTPSGTKESLDRGDN